MPWKKTDDGAFAVDGEHPVFVLNGTEFKIDGEQVLGKIADLTKESEKRRKDFEALEAKHKPYEALLADDGNLLDVTEIRKALETVKGLSSKKLMEADEANAVMQAAVEKAVATAKQELTARDSAIQELTGKLEQKEKAWAFGQSKYVQDRLAIKPPHALKLYGESFKVEGDQLVGYLRGEKISSRKTFGELAPFDEALEILVEADPFKDAVLKSEAGGGSGAAHSTEKSVPSGKRMSRTALDAMTPEARMKWFQEGGVVTDAAA